MTTIHDGLNQATRYLTYARQAHNLLPENPRLDAQILLGYVLAQERVYLFTHSEQELHSSELDRWKRLLERRAQGEPLAYLTGHKEFYGLDLLVDPRVLIPRPETELLVELAREFVHKRRTQGEETLVADIGTGSGALAISLAVHEPDLEYIYAVDISEGALEVARLNCQRQNVTTRVRLLQGDLLGPLPEAVDLLLANLPYVGTDELETLQTEVRDYEPHLALFSGPDGLDLPRKLLNEAYHDQKLRVGGALLLEIGYRQKEVLSNLALHYWPQARVTGISDYAGWDRLLKIEISF